MYVRATVLMIFDDFIQIFDVNTVFLGFPNIKSENQLYISNYESIRAYKLANA